MFRVDFFAALKKKHKSDCHHVDDRIEVAVSNNSKCTSEQQGGEAELHRLCCLDHLLFYVYNKRK